MKKTKRNNTDNTQTYNTIRQLKIARNFIILGTVFVIVSTSLSAYYIPYFNSTISKFESNINDQQIMNLQLDNIQYLQFVPIHLKTFLDVFPNSPSWIRDDLDYEIRKAQIGYMSQLIIPYSFDESELTKLRNMSTSELENRRISMLNIYLQANKSLYIDRKILLNKKEDVLFLITIAQLLGIILTTIGSSMKIFYKN